MKYCFTENAARILLFLAAKITVSGVSFEKFTSHERAPPISLQIDTERILEYMFQTLLSLFFYQSVVGPVTPAPPTCNYLISSSVTASKV